MTRSVAALKVVAIAHIVARGILPWELVGGSGVHSEDSLVHPPLHIEAASSVEGFQFKAEERVCTCMNGLSSCFVVHGHPQGSG